MCVYGPPRDDDAEPGCGQLHAINVVPDVWGTGLGSDLLGEAQRRLAADVPVAGD